MKTLMTITTVFLLILAVCVFAAETPPTPQNIPTVEKIVSAMPAAGLTVLKLDPMTEEIVLIRKNMLDREEALLTKLFQAQTELQSERVLQQINQLDMERELAILRVQMRYARIDGRFDLEREIKEKIVSMVNNDMAMLP